MRFIFFVYLLIAASSVFAQQDRIWMHPNRGQWHENIKYKVELTGGEMYLENQGFTYSFYNASEVYHASHEGKAHKEVAELKGYAIRSVFLGSNPAAQKEENDFSEAYRSYFIGNDQSRWKSQVYSAGTVTYHDFYPSIDLEVKGNSSHLEYSFTIAPGQDVSQIKMKIDGGEKVFIDDAGNLNTTHPFGEIVESAPKAWTIDENGRKTSVAVRFALKKQVVSYVFPDGYDHAQTLVIDPELTFSTFTGSTSDNWGFTAAPDASAKVFAAGIVFGPGYPITTGAYNPTFVGGSFDIGVTKFNATGTALMFSTYIGGHGVETPHTIVCNANNELYLMGATSSSDFPMPGPAVNSTFSGGPMFNENGLTFIAGADIYVARLNASGTLLLSSTYIGGTGTDGINRGNLKYNYGDQFRGDIAIDPTGNVYVTSTTESNDFPVNNGFQFFLNGGQDAVIFKLNPTLNTLIWSTFFGGSGHETGNSLQIASNGNVYVAGGTTSASLGFPSGHMLTNSGGADGYVIRVNGAAPFVLSGTYIGTSDYDQAYFVQLDLNNQVYIYGQTEGTMPITPGKYGTPNSGQYIKQYSTNLATLAWTTTVGSGTGHVEISPTAFLVSDCFEIYISGWGGFVNVNNSFAIHSSSNGFQVTPDAFQSNTNGSNFYIAVLGAGAVNLKYATFMGGITASSNHVDGGTSRFDKSGRIYHAVCGACQSNDFGFTTTPGVWSPSNPGPNCNLAAFKFELNHIDAIVSQPAPLICLPSPVVFNNNSSNGNTFQWNFGDNTTSNQVNPSHVYGQAGTYQVTLVVSDSSGCFSSDTTQFIVNIGDFNGQVIAPSSPICPGTPYQFDASGGSTYSWSPANLLNNPNIPNPVATVTQTTVFTVVISDSCGTDTISVTLQVLNGASTSSGDTSICIGNSVDLMATGGTTYVWSPATGLSNPNIANPVATPTQTTTYSVVITTGAGCTFNENVTITVILTPPNPDIPDTVGICRGLSKTITVSGADTYQWSPPINITPTTGSTVTINPPVDMMYYCDFINACGVIRDSVFADLVDPNITAGFDTTICPGESAPIYAFGGVSYTWNPASTLSSATGSPVIAHPSQNTTYAVYGIDVNGCVDTAYVNVSLFPQPFIQTVPDIYAFFGDVVKLGATSTTPGPFVWDPAEYLSCVVCPEPIAAPDKNMEYTVTYTDANGCSASDSVRIIYDAILYVPNTFTPDDNLFNEVFKAMGGNVKTFEMSIYNRWGERIVTLNSLDESWDGTYKGMACPDGTYVWKIVYTDFNSKKEKKMAGHINLLR